MSTETRVSFCTMGSSLLLTSSDSGTSMPTESQEESISSLKLTAPGAMERRSLAQCCPDPIGSLAEGGDRMDISVCGDVIVTDLAIIVVAPDPTKEKAMRVGGSVAGHLAGGAVGGAM